MGAGSSKKSSKKFKKSKSMETPSSSELQTYIMVTQAKLTQLRNKKIVEIRKKTDECIRSLSDMNIEMAKLKAESILRNEDTISALDMLGVLCEMLKEKVTYILLSETVPEDLKPALDTMVFASTRVDIDEFLKLRTFFEAKFGNKYVAAADVNKDKVVIPNIAKRLTVDAHPDMMIRARLRIIANDNDIDVSFPEDIEIPIVDCSNPFSNPSLMNDSTTSIPLPLPPQNNNTDCNNYQNNQILTNIDNYANELPPMESLRPTHNFENPYIRSNSDYPQVIEGFPSLEISKIIDSQDSNVTTSTVSQEDSINIGEKGKSQATKVESKQSPDTTLGTSSPNFANYDDMKMNDTKVPNSTANYFSQKQDSN